MYINGTVFKQLCIRDMMLKMSACAHTHFLTQFPMSSREYVFMRKAWVSGNEDAIVLINR